ncbi:MAG: MerR family DNA-binding protein [Deferrisomatales bacterium]|nr:MerR family DNA-binding protein [Deferrisomatales bacterium]
MNQDPTIGQVAKAAGVGVETVRFYERKGLVARPARAERGFRRYPPETVSRVRFIRRAKKLGFTLREIAELLDLRADPSCDEVRARAEGKLADITGKIASLERMRAVLEELVGRCRTFGTGTECPILAAMEWETEDPGGGVEKS